MSGRARRVRRTTCVSARVDVTGGRRTARGPAEARARQRGETEGADPRCPRVFRGIDASHIFRDERSRGGRSDERLGPGEKRPRSTHEYSVTENCENDFRFTSSDEKVPRRCSGRFTRRGARIGTPRGGNRREGRGVALDARSQETPAIFIEEGKRARGSSALVGESRAKLGERKRGTQERVSANGRYAPRRRRRRRARAARGPRSGRAPTSRADRALTPASASLAQSAIDERRANGRIVCAVKERTLGA